MIRVVALALLLTSCAGAVVAPVRVAVTSEALEAEAPAPAPAPAPEVTPEVPAPVAEAPEIFPLKAGAPAPVDGLLVVPDRYVKMIKAESSCAVPSVPANPACSEPLVKGTTAFWAGMAIGSVLGVVATAVVVYGAVEVVKAAK